MKHAGYFFVAVIVAAMFTPTVPAEDLYEAGEKWIYEHKGPRPWVGNENVYGDRVRKTISFETDENQKQYWLLRESWGNYDDTPVLFYIYEDKSIPRERAGDTLIQFDPGLPAGFIDLEPEQEKTYNIEITWGDSDRKIPLKIIAKRLADEDVEVPAGQFANCVRIQTKWEFTFTRDERSVAMKSTQDIWYDPETKHMLKEAYAFEPVSWDDNTRPAWTCTSQLKEYIPAPK